MCKVDDKITAAELVDHIIPLRKGGHRIHDDNLMSLCRDHHKVKTGWDKRKGGWPGRILASGHTIAWPFKGKLADGVTEPEEEEKPKKRVYRAPYSRD